MREIRKFSSIIVRSIFGCEFVASVGLDYLLDILLANGALFIDNLAALLTEDSMATRYHNGVDRPTHANLAAVVLLDVCID